MTREGIRIAARLGLGTAQLGLAYGVTNLHPRLADAEVRALLARAEQAGVRVLDTAAAYGDSEAVIGRCVQAASAFRIVTKTPAVSEPTVSSAHAEAFHESLKVSLARLNRPAVDALLVHHGQDVAKPGGERIVDFLQETKARGQVQHIGVSIYTGQEIDAVLERFTPDIVQLPISLADQRLIESGHLRMLKGLGIEIHARSLFLQGVLLSEPGELPSYFAAYDSSLSSFSSALHGLGLTRLEACLGFALARMELDTLLVGVAHATELDQILAAADRATARPFDTTLFAQNEEKLLDPTQWRI